MLANLKGVDSAPSEIDIPQPVTYSERMSSSGIHELSPSRVSFICALIIAVLWTACTIATLAVGKVPVYRPSTLVSSITDMQRDIEAQFLSVLSPKKANVISREYTSIPHLAGSAQDLEDAKSILKLLQMELNISSPPEFPVFSAGSADSRKATLSISDPDTPPQAWVDVYYPVLNTPVSLSLEILSPDGGAAWTADLVEDGNPLDPEAAMWKNAVQTFHGLSREGEATGQLIYVNYGRKEDYDELDSLGANLTGKIVLARYGGNFRGLKIKGAEERGAVGVLIYSDPRDDGSVTVENGYSPYPYGPARNPTSVQRGSVQYISIYPGDPTTPGYPAYENSHRTEGTNIPTIPSLPISWANAKKLLETIDGNDSRTLNGRVSEEKIKLVNLVSTKITPIWNTMATIPGVISDEVVLVACHRDAWVLGGADPVSGTVSLTEIIRGLGALVRSGWKPRRTILIASWDAEEYGLVGSTEWGEDFPDWIPEHVVAYLNVDVSVSGSRYSASASPSLAPLIRQIAEELPHPLYDNQSLWDARLDVGPYNGPKDRDSMHTCHEASSEDTGVSPLGSGSDYTVFLQRLGIASADQGFGYTSSDAVYHYHSIYDSQHWQELYGDPTFTRHVAVAKHLGLMALRMADSVLLPLNTTQYAFELSAYYSLLDSIAKSFSPKPDFHGLKKSIEDLQAASLVLDKVKEAALLECLYDMSVPFDKNNAVLGRLWNMILRQFPALSYLASRKVEKQGLPVAGNPLSEGIYGIPGSCRTTLASKKIAEINKKLATFERGFISKDGIKDREWYKHLVVAPGKWLGYGATTLPAVTEALTIDKNVSMAEYEAQRLTKLIHNLANSISKNAVNC